MNCNSAGKIARTRVLLGIAAALTMLLAACSGGGSAPISVTISTAPPSSLNVSQTTSVAATVTNDSSNAGVDWSCAPVGSCGSFSPTHTASGSATTYTAPASATSVTITATSTANSTKTATATVTITPPISITISTAPPSTLNASQTATVAATVTNDSSNAGVNWSCAPVSSCGSFSPTHTASGATTTYTAPASATSVTITATSAANSTKTATAMVTIIPPISITITTAPPSSLNVDQTFSVAATVANDASNAGVDWSCAPAGSCGSFSPTHTASGATTTYTAPASATSVTITATSTANPTKTATATVNVVRLSVSSLSGTYTFYATGYNTIGDESQVAGSIILDGHGNVTGGEQDRANFNGTGVVDSDDAITGGTVTDGINGRAMITVTTAAWGSETFSVTLVNSKHLLLTEFDAIANSQGSMDLQTAPTSVPMGGNAFALLDKNLAFAFGGVITSDGVNITAGEADDNSGTPDLDFNPSVASAITSPDAAGRGTILLYDQAAGGNLQFAYYVVGPEAFRLVEIDETAYLVGSMFGQGSSAGTFSKASLNGGFAFEQNGWDENEFFVVAGQFNANGAGSFSTGQMDVNDTPAAYPAADISGSAYGAHSDGYGSITLSPTNGTDLANFGAYLVDSAINITDPNSSTGGGGALLLEVDTGSAGAGPGAGFAVPQQLSGATFIGNYAFNLGNGYAENSTVAFHWFDLIGQVLSDGVSKLTGTADLSSAMASIQDAGGSITGTFAADTAHPGRSTAQITVNGSATPNNITAYQASSGLLLQVDMDPDSSNSANATIAIGVLEQQP